MSATNCPAAHAAAMRHDLPRRWRGLRRLLAGLLFAFMLMPALAQQVTPAPPTEAQKIDYLIATVAALHDASFIRNGTAYDAARAAAHLRLKRRYAGSRVKTAEDFIVYCATASSMSGVRYSIRFVDGRSEDAATFLRHRLVVYDGNPDAFTGR